MKLEPTIIFEHKDFLALNKPAGMLVHEDGKTDAPSVTAWLVSKFPETKDVGEMQVVTTKGGEEKIPRPGIVHRLDRDTSGVLIVARNQDAYGKLKARFMERLMEKTYIAFTYGWIKEEEGMVDAAIGRSTSEYRKMTSNGKTRGLRREAKTGYKVLGRFVNTKEKFSYVELYPKTGRTHQLRAHLKHLLNPIVADRLYGGKLARGKRPALGFKRQALHAKEIAFEFGGEDFRFTAKLPEDFQKAEGMMEEK